MAISTAVGSERISRIVGYMITKGNFANTTPNLPQRIAVLGEANTANQAGLDLTPTEITTLQQAGEKYGYGSPLYNMMRILRPVNGVGVGGIPVIAYPQAEASGAVAAQKTVTPTGTANANATHTVVINGRRSIDGQSFDFNIETGDTVAIICGLITDVVNSVLGATVIATDGTTKVDLLSKWKGITSEQLNITIDRNDNEAGMTYTVTSTATGSATPDIATALNLFGDNWNTVVINPYGSSVLSDLEDFNGIPDATLPTGRYAGIIMKPFVSIFGSVSKTPSTLTGLMSARTSEVTNAIAPAPGSAGWSMEAAANMAVLFARKMQDTPNLDVNAMYYPDMPIPTDGLIGDMSDYTTRDSLVKNGVSTVTLETNKYRVQDFVTSYRPDGEIPPQFRYPRNIMIDFNVKFGYYLLEQINVVDHTIAADNDVVTATNVIKPKQWIQIIRKYAADLVKRGLVADVSFMQDSIQVGINGTNPDRLDTFFKYKRTGIARISSTTAEAGFNFGE